MNFTYTPPIRNIFLKIGEVYITQRPSKVVTVLGSCTSVTMYYPKLKMGGICHSLLPNCNDFKVCFLNIKECFKYVDCSVTYMARKFKNAGAAPEDIIVKLYGGAQIFQSKHAASPKVGEMNIRSAKECIEKEGLKLSEIRVGGERGVKILFHTHTGEVQMIPTGRIPGIVDGNVSYL